MQRTKEQDNAIAPEITPVDAVLAIGGTTDEALSIMDATGLDFTPVVDDAGAFAGIVLRRAVERGCRAMGHVSENCRVINHLKRNVQQHILGESFGSDVNAGRERGPVVVLSREGAPVGILQAAG
ncbi:MAG: hypothetical protein WEB88_12625 [Gemmatimonadota bacterium]